ncbi:winged helix-turn-helix domain-containing protein [Erwinia sp. V90_4]|uniref:winged helix-turn-helix domain-containing protein n=1 Tax=Erwinia sp. V90_4 TaxID=3044239 RepID=UPI00249F49C7|nr:winged helix-turn-helix domain-containing protein [Erwinia sp. V90_4]MDI3438275.1 winged helix-turn-helix domain-containing protein [Erwinia sp. V90_4]
MDRVFIINDAFKFTLSENKVVAIGNDKRVVKLRASASFCFALLLDKQGELVTHNELYAYAWERFKMPSSINVLHNTIFYLRKSMFEIGLDGNLIETIPRRGFVLSRKISVIILNIENGLSDNISPTCEITTNPEDSLLIQGGPSSPHTHEDIYLHEPSAPETKKTKIKRQALGKIDLIFIFALSFILIYLTYIFSFPSIKSPLRYHQSGNYLSCTVFQNRSNNLVLPQLHPIEELCSTRNYLYVSNLTNAKLVSIIACKDRLSYTSNDDCTSFIFTLK